MDDEAPDVRGQADEDLRNWLGKEAASNYSVPDDATAQALQRMIGFREDKLGGQRATQLRFYLGLRSGM